MKQWRVRAAHEAAARRLQQEMEIAPAFARLLAARGFDSAAAAQSFLSEETEFARSALPACRRRLSAFTARWMTSNPSPCMGTMTPTV